MSDLPNKAFVCHAHSDLRNRGTRFSSDSPPSLPPARDAELPLGAVCIHDLLVGVDDSDASAGETILPGRQVTERRLGCGILAVILDSVLDRLSTWLFYCAVSHRVET